MCEKKYVEMRIFMDLMIGTIDYMRLRSDLLKYYHNCGKRYTVIRNSIDMVEMANEQQLVAIAKKENIELRKYMM